MALRNILLMIQLLGYRVHIVRIDNNSVILGKNFQAVCTDFKIVVQRSVSYRYHQLGRMERQYTKIYDIVVAILDDSMLDSKFWGNAFLVVVYVRVLV